MFTILSVRDIVGEICGNVDEGIIGGMGGAWDLGPPGGVNTMDCERAKPSLFCAACCAVCLPCAIISLAE